MVPWRARYDEWTKHNHESHAPRDAFLAGAAITFGYWLFGGLCWFIGKWIWDSFRTLRRPLSSDRS